MFAVDEGTAEAITPGKGTKDMTMISIIEQSGGGTHLLVAREGQFAIIERRNNRFYSCHAGKRDGVAADDLSAISKVVDETDWVDEAIARGAFAEVISRGTDLAERML